MRVDRGPDVFEAGEEQYVHLRLAGQLARALEDVFVVVDEQEIFRLQVALMVLGHHRGGDEDAVFFHAHSEVAARGVGEPAIPHALGDLAHL